MDNQTNDNEKLRKEVEELKERNKKQEKRVHNLEIRALQLTNLYFVFQGVILSTIATKNLKCHHAWVPFVLSLLAALLNTAAMAHTIYCFVKCSEELDKNREDLRDMEGRLDQQDMSQEGSSQNPADHEASRQSPADQEGSRQSPADPIRRKIRLVCSAVSFGLFLGFSVVILYGCFNILCSG